VAFESWAIKYLVQLESVGAGPTPVILSERKLRCLQLLRTRGLSIKNLDSRTRADISRFLVHLHHERGMSLSDIAKLIGNKSSGYTSWLCKQLGVTARPDRKSVV